MSSEGHSGFLHWCHRHTFSVAFFLLAGNIALRFYNVSYGSFDLDEAWHTFFSQYPLYDLLAESANDPNPPLYNILIGVWIKVFGISETGVRSMSVILSALTAPLLFLHGRKHFNTETAIGGALLFTVANKLFFYAHDARVYALAGFLTVSSFYTFFNLIKNSSLLNLALYSAVMTLLLYTHTTTLFLFPVQLAGGWLYYGKRIRAYVPLLAGQTIAVGLFGLWVYSSPYYNKPHPASWIEPPGTAEISFVLYEFFNNSWAVAYLVLAVVIAAAVKLFFLEQDSGKRKIFLILLAWSLLPCILNYTVSHLLVGIFATRYMLYASIGVWTLAAFSLSCLPWWPLKTGLLAGTIIISCFRLELNTAKQEDWRGAVNYVKQIQDKNTLVIVSPYFQFSPFAYYYNRNFYGDYKYLFTHLTSSNVCFSSTPDILSLKDLRFYDKIILLTTHEKVADPGALKAVLKKKGSLITTKTFRGIKTFQYRLTHSASTDARMLYKNFEDFPDEEFIADNIYPGGKSRVFITRPGKEFCEALNIGWKNIPQPTRKVEITYGVYADSARPEGVIVCSFERSGGSLHYQTWPLKGLTAKVRKEIRFMATVPPGVRESDLIKIYLWNTGSVAIRIDDIRIRFLPQ